MSDVRLSFQHPALIKPFADYCKVQGWAVQFVLLDEQQCELVVAQADVDKVRAEFTRFVRVPADPRYQSAAWELGETGVSYGDGWWRQLQVLFSRGSGPLSWLLLFSCILVYALQQWQPAAVFNTLMFFPDGPAADNWLSWRWFTPALMHLSTAHLLLNMSLLLTLGGSIERRQGALTLGLLTLIGGLFANIAQYWLVGPWFAGFSGVGYTIVGFYFLMGLRAPRLQYQLAGANFYLAVVFMLAGFADLLWINTANWAHFVGLLCGLCIAALYPAERYNSITDTDIS